MAISTTEVANTIQPRFSKKLLTLASEKLELAQYAVKESLPAKSGNKTITFFRRKERAKNDPSRPQIIAEGVTPANRVKIEFDPVEVKLTQRGQIADVTDIATTVGLIDYLEQAHKVFADEMANDADTVMRDQLVHPVTGLQKRYAQSLETFADLTAAPLTGGKLTPDDILDAATQLKINGAPKIKGVYVALVSPQVAADIMKNPEWKKVVRYEYAERIFKGEIGDLSGVRIVEHSNSFIEKDTEGTFDDSDEDNQIHSTIVLGGEAFGCVDMSMKNSSSPFKPSIIVNDKPDKADPLNLIIVTGWKSYWGSAVLNRTFGQVIRSKTVFKKSK